MNFLLKTFILLYVSLFFCKDVSAISLDELYRDIIRADNRGYLPLFVKNRKTPDVVSETNFDGFNNKTISPQADNLTTKLSPTPKIKKRDALDEAKKAQWIKTIAAVKSNQVTPLELNDITSRVKENDPKAIEILAWMYTKGIGVNKDFVEAFNLYKKAASLNVGNAQKNAVLIYKSMSEDQRNKVRNFN